MTQAEDSAVAEVKKQVELIYERLARFPWNSRPAYAQWLAQTYFYVRRVTHVLSAGASRTRLDQRDLHEHFLRGISEEKDHDQLLVSDLKDLDYDVESFTEHPLTQAFYQTLFYMIDNDGPEAVLGYFFVLEGVAGERGQGLYRQVQAAYHGRAEKFLEEHVVLDADHFPQALKMLSTLDEQSLRIVERSARLAGEIYRYLISAIEAESVTD